jgi:hypothetical protein
MSRREAWLSVAAVFGLALAIRAAAAAVVVFPVPEDTAYYAGVARNLVEGRGLVSDALWSYQTQPLLVPRAAFEVWQPLPTFLAAIPMLIAGAADWFRAAQVVSVVAGAAVAALSWRLGADVAVELALPVGRARTLAVGTGVACSALGPLVVYGALPDSTAIFAALALAACLLMTRIDRGRGYGAAAGAPSLRPLAALGALLGFAALARSEAMWLALAWVLVAWTIPGATRRRRASLVVVPLAVAAAVYAPWALRNWAAFGSPLPGQTAGNALYTAYTDLFAWVDPPTLSRYLAQGPGPILAQHLAGIAHDLVNVLVLPAFPIGLVGLLCLPRVWRLASLRPLVIVSGLMFAITSLVFPVSTQAGTFLHASGAVLVLLVVSTLAALDAGVAWTGRVRGWTRPVAWIGPAFAVAAIAPLTWVSVGTIAGRASDEAALYAALPAALDRAGIRLETAGSVITDTPIWLAEATRTQALALPEEAPGAVVDLARHFGARLLIVRDDGNRAWPDILATGSAEASCFSEVHLTDTSGTGTAISSPLSQLRVFRIVCP